MKELKIESIFTVFDNLDELPKEVSDLMQRAIGVRQKAYAPYSNFSVGVAILLDNNEIVTGNNQENASYPSGLCAERTAIYYAGSQFPDAKIIRMAISAGSRNHQTMVPIPPCGAGGAIIGSPPACIRRTCPPLANICRSITPLFIIQITPL